MQPTDHPDPVSPNISPLLDVAQLAKLLGVDIRHVRRLVHEKRIPYIKWGHLVRFDLAEIKTWIDTCRHQPGRPRV